MIVDQLLTMGEAAKVLGVVPASVRRFADTGILPALRTVGGVRLVRKSDVDALAAKRAERPDRRTPHDASKRRGTMATEPVGVSR